MKKKLITFTLLACIIVCQININPIQSVVASSTENQYIILTETENGHAVSTDTLTSYEANKIKALDGVVVVEKDGVVKGSWIKNNVFNKQTQEKRINQNSNLSSENWNKRIINADAEASYPMKMINADSNASSTANSVSGSAIKIALIDSGVNYDENINIVERKNFIENDENVSYLYEDISGHGTSIAGILGSKEIYVNDIIGINPNVKIYSARVLDKDLSAPTSRVVEAIYWAISKGVNIISICFGTAEESDALKVAIQDAYNAGILIIAATGNNGVVEYPAAYSEVMAVGSVNQEGNVSDFSPISDKLEIVAPGENITSSAAFGGKMTGCAGTSLSVPHIVGVASVLWQKDTTKSADFIRNLLDYSANLYGDSKSYGNGLVDEEYALNIYDKFSGIYSETDLNSNIRHEKDLGGLSYNSSELNTSYVEGNWTGAGHQYLLSNADIKSVLSEDKYKAMMYGCTYPDKFLRDIKQFHGFLWIGTEDSNYIGCNMYLTAIASKLSTGTVNSSTVGNVGGMFSTDYTALNGNILCSNTTTGSGYVYGVPWSTICSNVGASNTPENRAAFVYGLALHSITDMIAHSSWWPTTDRRSWFKVIHSSDSDGDGIGNADDTDYIYSRYYNAATLLGRNIIMLCHLNLEANITFYVLDQYRFNMGMNPTEGTQEFLLGNYRYYGLLASSGFSGIEQSFQYGDLFYQCTKYGYNYQYTYNGYTHPAR